MRVMCSSAVLITTLLASSFLFADSAPLTWQECLRLAAEQNPDLQSAMRAEAAGRYGYRGSYNGLLPRLALSNSLTDGSNVSVGSRWQAGANATIDVFSLENIGSVHTAAARWRQAQASLRQASAKVLSDLQQAFAGLLFAQEQVAVSARIQELRKNNADMIRLRYDSGRESRGNWMRTDAERLEADLDTTQSERDRRAAQQILARSLGRDHFEALTVTGPFSPGQLPSHPPDLGALVLAHPRVALQQATLDQARAGLTLARASYIPTLSASYARNWRGETEFPRDPSWTASGILSLPIFGSGPTASFFGSAAARQTLAQAEQDLRSAKNEALAELESAWSAYAQALDQVRLQKAFLDAARQRRRESDVRYENGLMTFENWASVVADLVNFERSALRSERDAVNAAARWNLAVGEPLKPS